MEKFDKDRPKFDEKVCSYIYPEVILGEHVEIGMFCLIGLPLDKERKETCIGNECFIGSRTTIYAGAKLAQGIIIEGDVIISSHSAVGENCKIGPKSVLRSYNMIGDNVRIHSHAFLERVVVGDNVFIGPHVVFTADRHPPCPRYTECTPETIVESFVSIGANVTLAPAVTIGHHSQIYAGSVITRDVEPYSVIAGNPARKIKNFNELKCSKGFFNKPFEWWKEQSGG